MPILNKPKKKDDEKEAPKKKPVKGSDTAKKTAGSDS